MSGFNAHRYSRHLLLPEIGREGQEKLLQSRVLIVGAGGLGGPAALYLAGAGIGTIGIADFDRIEESNLQRQIQFSTADLGLPKAEVLARRLQTLNPDPHLRVHPEAIRSGNAREIIADYDIIIDGTDNYPARYLLNDACFLSGKPLVYGSVYRFEGQISLFHPPGGSPCYRCLFPEPPPVHQITDCSAGGVLGVLPGLIGSLQALEAIKFLLNIGEPAMGRLIMVDALSLEFRTLKVGPKKDCPLCGEKPTLRDLIDYEEFCGYYTVDLEPAMTVEQLRDALKLDLPPFLLDVREPTEHQYDNLGGLLIPLKELPQRMNEIPRDRQIVVYCHAGARSARAVNQLRKAGFANVFNLTGGMEAWWAMTGKGR